MQHKFYDALLTQIQTIQDDTFLKDYHAFTYWFVDTVFGWEKKEILNSICDGMHDKGVDAVLIDPIEQHVVIIQSKFEHKGGHRQVKESEIKQFATVREYFKSRKALIGATANANQTAKRLLDKAFDVIHKKKYTWELIFITTHKEAPQIDDLIYKTFAFKPSEFRVYYYDRIIQLLKDKLRDFTPILATYSLPYKDTDGTMVRISRNRSWVLTIPTEQIRLMVNKYQDKLFRKNVRNFLGKSTCNKAIKKTLKHEPEIFWYYNNGISILCDDANLNVEKKFIRLVNPQIVNGCQTARSIESFRGVLDGEVLVRVIESKSHNFINSLTLFQNSSNPVKERDFKSNDPVQVRLKHELRRRGFYYEIKRGEEYKTMKKKFPALKQEYFQVEEWGSISNEAVAKVLAAIKLGPAIAASRGSETFFDDEVYGRLFPEKISTYNCLAPVMFYKHFIKESYRGQKRFHKLKKARPFKNRASHYVLKFLYESMDTKDDWEKKFVAFCEDSTVEEYRRFSRQIKKAINEQFEVVYRAWQGASKDGELDYNAYLQSSTTLEQMKKKFSKDILVLSRKTRRIFAKFLD